MKKHLAKGIVGIALAGAGVFSGVTMEQDTITALQNANAQLESDKSMLISEVDTEKSIKEKASDAYIYAMISSGRKPAIDVMPLNDLEASYVRTVGTVNISDTDLFDVGTREAKLKGDYICK